MFCKRLFDLKLPYGYSSKISNCKDMEKHKLIRLKAHDYHVIMQQLCKERPRLILTKHSHNIVYKRIPSIIKVSGGLILNHASWRHKFKIKHRFLCKVQRKQIN